MKWTTLRNHIWCMAHVIKIALGEFPSIFGVKGHTKSVEACEWHQRCAENKIIHIGNSQRLRRVGNARVCKVTAIRTGLAKIIDKVRISTYFETPEMYLHIADTACCIDCADTRLSKRVHWLSKSENPCCRTPCHECEDILTIDTGVAWVNLPITSVYQLVAPESNIVWLPATLHNTRWMDHCQGCHGTFPAIPVLDAVDVNEAYCHIPRHNQFLQWHVSTYWWGYVNFIRKEDLMAESCAPSHEVSATQAVEIFC